MVTQISVVAGEVLLRLEEYGEMELSRLLEYVDRPHKWVLMGLGWLLQLSYATMRCPDEHHCLIVPLLPPEGPSSHAERNISPPIHSRRS